MTWIKVNYEDIHEVEWDKYPRFALCEIYVKGEGKVAQIYPHELLKADEKGEYTGELCEYDRRVDGKRYFSTGLMDNGFTPKNTIGTCRGWSKNYFDEIVDAIIEYGRKQSSP